MAETLDEAGKLRGRETGKSNPGFLSRLTGHVRKAVSKVTGEQEWERSQDAEKIRALLADHPELKKLLEAKPGERLSFPGTSGLTVMSRRKDQISFSRGDSERFISEGLLGVMEGLISAKKQMESKKPEAAKPEPIQEPEEEAEAKAIEYPTNTALPSVDLEYLKIGTHIVLKTMSGSKYMLATSVEMDQKGNRSVTLVSAAGGSPIWASFEAKKPTFIEGNIIKVGQQMEFTNGGKTSKIAEIQIEPLAY